MDELEGIQALQMIKQLAVGVVGLMISAIIPEIAPYIDNPGLLPHVLQECAIFIRILMADNGLLDRVADLLYLKSESIKLGIVKIWHAILLVTILGGYSGFKATSLHVDLGSGVLIAGFSHCPAIAVDGHIQSDIVLDWRWIFNRSKVLKTVF